MGAWVQTHGFEVLIFAGIYSLIMSNAPQPPHTWGFWKLWAFGAMKALGASAAKIEKSNPLAQQFSQTQVSTDSGGSKLVTETAASSTPAVPDPNDHP